MQVNVDCGHAGWFVGSGLLVTDRLVLTAAHVVHDGSVTVHRVGDLRSDEPGRVARLFLDGGPDGVDLALLRLDETVPDIAPVRYARLDRTAPATHVRGWAVGFPQHRATRATVGGEAREIRESVQVDGDIPLAENLKSQMLSLHTGRYPRRLSAEQEARGVSQWSGMSGAAVIVGERVIGVITDHPARAGESALLATPIAAVDRLGPDLAAQWWDALGADPMQLLPVPASGPYAGATDDEDAFGKWELLVRYVDRGECTAILGPGLTDELLPSRQDIAARLADAAGVSLPFHNDKLADIAQVAQWLTVTQHHGFPRELFLEELCTRLGGAAVPASYEELRDLARRAAAQHLAAGHDEAHQLLAELRLRWYLTTHPLSFMEDAVERTGPRPRVAWCRWKDATWPAVADDVFASGRYRRPDRDNPIVYHLFGWAGDPASLVLTEDDYLDYVIKVTQQDQCIPDSVWTELTGSALLLLGFRLEDWDFRGLLRLILNQQGTFRLGQRTHVAVQVDPVASTLDADAAQRYLKAARRYVQEYFRKTGLTIEFTVYWGAALDFIRELHRRAVR
ncbi:SIR2 family protein [Dactylosporangium sp. NPDC050588]|uniref:SIR2 family protein n=1 Tax=Dactylosporangium sp. NPDC050588 TaxID=3157211 RepID=UPI0033DD3D89